MLCHYAYPWLTSESNHECGLAAAWYVLDTLSKTYYDHWDRIDVEAVIDKGCLPEASEEEEDAALAVAAEIDLEFESSGTAQKHRKLGQWNLPKIINTLTRFFGCESSPSKGSERTVYRPGFHKFTFGSHSANAKVQPMALRRCLKKLGVPMLDFLKASKQAF